MASPSLSSSPSSANIKHVLTPKKSNYSFLTTDQTPSTVKSEGRTILKQFESSSDNVEAAEDLYSLCLFAKNRKALLDTGILSVLALALKTKSDKVKQVVARILELFAQDGGEACIALRRLNMCKTTIEMISRTEDNNVRIPISGLVYWLAQNPSCKKEYQEMAADNYLRELNAKTKDPVLSKFLSYAINALSPSVKSREELLEDILNRPIEVKSIAVDHFESFNPYVSPSPRRIHNAFKSPSVLSTPMKSTTPVPNVNISPPATPSSELSNEGLDAAVIDVGHDEFVKIQQTLDFNEEVTEEIGHEATAPINTDVKKDNCQEDATEPARDENLESSDLNVSPVEDIDGGLTDGAEKNAEVLVTDSVTDDNDVQTENVQNGANADSIQTKNGSRDGAEKSAKTSHTDSVADDDNDVIETGSGENDSDQVKNKKNKNKNKKNKKNKSR